ncbi:hypothetical protein HOY82DRAFT_534973 [Tuber indicum]|nr:hypothetical protein HOY82DRAFT_534973 [Tuber indicum]
MCDIYHNYQYLNQNQTNAANKASIWESKAKPGTDLEYFRPHPITRSQPLLSAPLILQDSQSETALAQQPGGTVEDDWEDDREGDEHFTCVPMRWTTCGINHAFEQL